jgi:uncharacterized integral membrane protein (TIGR00697 family)
MMAATVVIHPASRYNSPVPITRKQLVFFVLGGFFLTNAILGELTGGKLFAMPALDLGLFRLPSVVLSIGVIPWPVVFITTDLINEYFGKRGVRRLTFLAVAMISYAFLLLLAAMKVPAWDRSPVPGEVFARVFGQSMWIIVGSLTAFLISQFVDVIVFHFVKNRTGRRLLWLRATGSTFVSQLIDTFVVGFIAFRLPSILEIPNYTMTADEYLRLGAGNYMYKVLIAIAVTPLIYLAHGVIDRFLEADTGAAPQAVVSAE